MFELYGCDSRRLEDPDLLHSLLQNLPSRIDMTAVSPVHLYDIKECTDEQDNGLSGFVIIAQSHISIHAWPPYHELDVDICSCQPFDYDVAVRYAMELTGATSVEVHSVNRANRSERDRKRGQTDAASESGDVLSRSLTRDELAVLPESEPREAQTVGR